MDKTKPQLDVAKLTPEQRAQLDAYNQSQEQLTALKDIADMTQESINLLEKNDPNANLEKMGALLVDMRGALRDLNDKEAPEQPDNTQPVIDAISKLEKALAKAVSAQKAPVVNVPKSDTPIVNVDAPKVDLSKVEKILKTDLPKAFQQAIQSIVIPENDDTATNGLLAEIHEKLQSIDVGVRLKPEPGIIKVTNADGTKVAGLVAGVDYDYIDSQQTSATVETYVYKLGGSGGTTVLTATVTFTDATKATLDYVEYS